jgi:hypothetical protein
VTVPTDHMQHPHLTTLRDHFKLMLFGRLADARAWAAGGAGRMVLFYTDAPTEQSPTSKMIVAGTMQQADQVWAAVQQQDDYHLHEVFNGVRACHLFLDIDIKTDAADDQILWRTLLNDGIKDIIEYERSEGRLPGQYVQLDADGFSQSKRAHMVSSHVILNEWAAGPSMRALITERVSEWEAHNVAAEILPYIDIAAGSAQCLRMPFQSKLDETADAVLQKRVFRLSHGTIDHARLTGGEFLPECRNNLPPPPARDAGASQLVDAAAKRARGTADEWTMEELRALASCFERQRMPYEIWINIGFALVQASRETGDARAANALYHTISRFSPKYDQKRTQDAWVACVDASNGKVGLGTYFHWAQVLDYSTYTRVRCGYHELRSLSPLDLAQLFRTLEGHRWAYDGGWYYCRDDAMWCPDEKAAGAFLLLAISRLGCDIVDHMDIGTAKEVTRFLKDVRSPGFPAQVAKFLPGMLLSPDFAFSLDPDPADLNFTNGVLRLDTGELRTRDPSDMLFRCTGYDLEMEVDSDLMQDVMETMHDVFIAEEEFDWNVHKLAMCLYGSNLFQTVTLDWGPMASNGKDSTLTWLYRALGGATGRGGYATFVSSSTLEKKNVSTGGSGPSPDLMQFRGARLIVATEFSNRAQLDDGVIKALGGMSMITARGLGKEPVTFQLSGHLHILVNVLPHIAGADTGTSRRIEISPWNTEFRDEEDPDPSKRFDPGNPQHRLRRQERTQPEYQNARRSALIHFLLPYLRQILSSGRMPPKPASVRLDEKNMRAGQDPVAEFIEQRCEHSEARYEATGQWLLDAFCVSYELQPNEQRRRDLFGALRAHKFNSVRRSRGTVYVGIRVRLDADVQDFMDPTVPIYHPPRQHGDTPRSQTPTTAAGGGGPAGPQPPLRFSIFNPPPQRPHGSRLQPTEPTYFTPPASGMADVSLD